MHLWEHKDFRDFLVATARSRKIPEQFVEKDYYVTEALRLVARAFPTQVIFKGGTSLSKGWNLIQRFSEDIDLFLNPAAFDPPLASTGAIDRRLKRLRDTVASHPRLVYEEPPTPTTIGGRSRKDWFVYRSHFDGLPILHPALLVEAGIQSGEQPTEVVELSSYVAEFLRSKDQGGLGDDTSSFPMLLLHYRRTFIEKMFAIHSKIVAVTSGGGAGEIGRHMRHYADLHILAMQPDVRAMLGTPEDRQIRKDYDDRSRQYFPRSHHPPPDLRFTDSIALFPQGGLRTRLEAEYNRECARLFIPPAQPPAFADVLAVFEEIRHLL